MASTIKEQRINQIEVMKSKFIAYFLPLDNEENFKPILAALRKEHKKARHIVYAYRIGPNSKSTDDREPKGTAGRPLLELLMKKNLNNTAIIVVRYYGGTQLGASRLLRTYVSSAVEAINKAELVNL